MKLDVKNIDEVRKYFQKYDVAISAIPYYFNYDLTKIAIEAKTHFLDLGGNNYVVEKQRSLFEEAKKNNDLAIRHDRTFLTIFAFFCLYSSEINTG